MSSSPPTGVMELVGIASSSPMVEVSCTIASHIEVLNSTAKTTMSALALSRNVLIKPSRNLMLQSTILPMVVAETLMLSRTMVELVMRTVGQRQSTSVITIIWETRKMQSTRLPTWIENYWWPPLPWWRPTIIGHQRNLFRKIAIYTSNKKNRSGGCRPTSDSRVKPLDLVAPWKGETQVIIKTTTPKSSKRWWMILLPQL